MSWMEQRRRATRRKQLVRVLVASIGLGAVLYLVGIALPVEHRTTARGSFDRPPEAVWRVLTDFDGMPLWRSDVVRVERLPDAYGRTTWREIGRKRDVIVELAESEPPRRLVTHRLMDGRPALPELTFHLVATALGTVLTVTTRERTGNPLRRLLVRLGAGASPSARLLHDLEHRLNVNRRRMAAEGVMRDGN